MNYQEFKDAYEHLLIKKINLKNKTIIFNEKTYKKREWFAKAAKFSFDLENNTIFINDNLNRRWDIIYYSFLVNVFKTSKINAIFLQAVFFLFSLITFSFGLILQNNANFGLNGFSWFQVIFLYFLSLFCILIFIYSFVEYNIMKKKLFWGSKNGQIRIVKISNEEYEKIIALIKQKIKEKYINFKPIETERLIIREFNNFDEDDIYNYASKERLYKYLMGKPIKSKKDLLVYVESTLENYHSNFLSKLAIYNKKDNRIIGYIGLSKYDYSVTTCQIVYAIDEEWWYHGYVCEAVLAFTKYLFDIKKEIIYAGHIVENINSGKVLLKAGFERLESKDNDLIIDGVKRHVWSYVLKKEIENEK